MASKIQFGFNIKNRIEAKIDKANIDTVLKKLNNNNILYLMGFDIKKNYCCVCDGQPKCEICIRGNEHIFAKSDKKLVWIERLVLKNIASSIERKYA
jgi:hypothetical protein